MLIEDNIATLNLYIIENRIANRETLLKRAII
jgi:hypothetical protein